MLSQASTLTQNETTFVRSFGTATYLFRQDWEDVVVLDGLGDWLWRSIAEPCTVEELVIDVAEVLGHDPELTHVALSRIVEELVDLGAVELLDADAI